MDYAVCSDTDGYMPWIPLQNPNELSWSLYVGAIRALVSQLFFAPFTDTSSGAW